MLLMTVGCSKDKLPSDLTERYEPSTEQIGFQMKWEDDDWQATKGALVVDTNFYNFGVLAYYLPANAGGEQTTFPSDAIPNFMYNQKVERTKTEDIWNSWTYSPVKYWSNNSDDRFKFFAYAPHSSKSSSSSITLSGNTEDDYPTVALIPATEARNQIDFMTAQTGLLHKGTKNGEVDLTFAHQLSQVLIAVKHNGTSTDRVVVEQVQLRELKAYAGQFEDGGFEWNSDALPDDLVYSMTLDEPTPSPNNSEIIPENDQITGKKAIKNTDYQDIHTEAGVFLVHPQTIDVNNFTISITFKHKKQADLEDKWQEKTVDIKASDAFTLKKNKAVRLKITLDLGGIKEPYVKFEVMPWRTVTNDENIHNYPMLNLRTPGWEDGGDNDLTNPAVPDLTLGPWENGHGDGELDETLGE